VKYVQEMCHNGEATAKPQEEMAKRSMLERSTLGWFKRSLELDFPADFLES